MSIFGLIFESFRWTVLFDKHEIVLLKSCNSKCGEIPNSIYWRSNGTSTDRLRRLEAQASERVVRQTPIEGVSRCHRLQREVDASLEDTPEVAKEAVLDCIWTTNQRKKNIKNVRWLKMHFTKRELRWMFLLKLLFIYMLILLDHKYN